MGEVSLLWILEHDEVTCTDKIGAIIGNGDRKRASFLV